MSELRIPLATYRLQLNRQFRFEDARLIVPYLSRLGITDLYVSPILKARQGSSHGYNVADPSSLNSELGTETDFEALVRRLKEHGVGLFLDIVPNHMAASPENPWWMDVMENGLCSPYAAFFDIDWNPPDSSLKNKVLLPILGSTYEQELENKKITLTLADTGFFIKYDDYRLPLDVKSYGFVLIHCLNNLKEALGSNHPDIQQLTQFRDVLERLPSIVSLNPEDASQQYRQRQAVKNSFLTLVNNSTRIKALIIALFNGEKGELNRVELMPSLLEQQVYRFAFWKTAYKCLNYRRFFDINDLVGVRVEEPEVFEATHVLIFQLIQRGKITGLRIDHIDGLFDPGQYLSRLQKYIAPKKKETGRPPDFYVVVEKILASGEDLPSEWPVFGTTGYDFASTVNGLFVDSKSMPIIDDSYSRFTESVLAFNDVVYEKKKQVIEGLFPGEVQALGRRLAHLARQCRHIINLSPKELTKALTEVTVCLPVYRTYIHTLEVSSRDQLYLECAIQEAQLRNPDMEATVFNLLKRLFLLEFPVLSSEQREAWLDFVLRWQQLTGAIMAKGFEDTALYNHNRLLSLNDVGGDPGSPGLSIDDFHRFNLERQEHWPHTLNATSTHDTKRSEDVKARINVLSEIAEEWNRHLIQWNKWNRTKKHRLNGLLVPEPNIEILLYQTLIGAWPFDEKGVPEFKQRLKVYMIKAIREAKVFTDWFLPNLDYESALITFLDSILDSKPSSFLEDFLLFEKQIAFYGALNSLAQVLLKVTSPGVPDFYQGTELWDFSLVDPDNRRPIDFEKRTKLLDALLQQESKGQQALVQQVLTSWADGRIKLYVTYKALNVRSSCREVFQEGQYIPLQIVGQRQENVLAFGRQKDKIWVLVVVPRLLTNLVNVGIIPIGREVWGDDELLLPEETPEHYLNIFTGEGLRVSTMERRLSLSQLLDIFPFAILVGDSR